MPDIYFPSQLPAPQRSGYGFNPVQTFVRTGMASGRAKQRRSFTSVPTMLPVSWMFTGPETMLFEAWFRDAINDGADWFMLELKTPLEPFGQLGHYRCRFTDMYSGPELNGCLWRISANLEVWERPMFPPGWAEFPEFITDADIIDRAVNENWPEHIPEESKNLMVSPDGATLVPLQVSPDGISLHDLTVEV